MNPIDLATYFFPWFLLIYAWNSWKDIKTKRVNAIPFAMLNGMLYVGFFLLHKNILIGLMLTVVFYLLWKYGKYLYKIDVFSIGDFSMLLPFSLLSFLFLDLINMILAYVILFVIGFVWLKIFKNGSFCPPVFFSIMLVFVKILIFS